MDTNKERHKMKKTKKQKDPVDWTCVDWGTPNKTLSENLGVSKQRVYQKREQLAPETLDKNRVDWETVDWVTHNNKTLSDMLGFSKDTIRRHRKINAPETIRTHAHPNRKDWESVDWSQSNQEISETIGATYSMVWKNRTLLANDTKPPRRECKDKVDSLVSKEKSHIVADDFFHEIGIRVAGYKQGVKVSGKKRTDNKVNMKLAGKYKGAIKDV
jgi:hypothetical protein